MDILFSFLKRRFFNYVLVLLAVLAFGMAFYGWWQVYPGIEEPGGLKSQFLYALGQALRAFVFSDVYAGYGSSGFSPEIELAGMIGSLVAVSAILKAALQLFIKPIERLRAERRRGHVVVFGDREIARNAAEELDTSTAVTYHGDDPHMLSSRVLSVPRPQNLRAEFIRKSVDGADRVIVAELTDAQTAETALSLAEFTRKSTIFAVLKNPWIASNLRQTSFADLGDDKSEDEFIAVSETRALARTAILRVPPFLLARKAGQRRVHVLFFGFDALTLAMIEEILFSNLMPDQKLPRFTVLTEQAFAAEAMFTARYPGFIAETNRSDFGPLDINFIECNGAGIVKSAADQLRALSVVDPVTVAYVTSPDDREPLAAAIAVQSAARQMDLFACPICVQSRHGNGLKALTWQEEFAPLSLHAFGAWQDLSEALGLLDRKPDKLAKAYHESYRRAVLDDHGADRKWEVLPEAFRMANRHAVLHLPAKLAALGFDVSPYLEQKDALSPSTAPKVRKEELIVRTAEERETMAILEHERWMMERWVSGWRYNPIRNNDKLHHPNLVPYGQLDEKTKDFDRLFVDWLETFIERSNSGVSRGA